MKTPFAPVVPEAGVNVLLDPVADGVTVAPLITLPRASRTVTVTVDAVVPAAQPVPQAVIEVGAATTDD